MVRDEEKEELRDEESRSFVPYKRRVNISRSIPSRLSRLLPSLLSPPVFARSYQPSTRSREELASESREDRIFDQRGSHLVNFVNERDLRGCRQFFMGLERDGPRADVVVSLIDVSRRETPDLKSARENPQLSRL